MENRLSSTDAAFDSPSSTNDDEEMMSPAQYLEDKRYDPELLDSNAEVDLNIVLEEQFEILEIQGTAEGKPFPKDHLDQLFELGKECIKEVFEIQK